MAAAVRSAELRRAGRLQDARRSAADVSALATALARRDPAELRFHLIGGEAFLQESKIALAENDRAASEAALRQALAEARIAVRLDPGSTEARVTLNGLLDKLILMIPDQVQSLP